jgi:hypothetical protein
MRCNPSKEPKTLVQVLMDQPLKQELQARAILENRSLANLINYASRIYLDRISEAAR